MLEEESHLGLFPSGARLTGVREFLLVKRRKRNLELEEIAADPWDHQRRGAGLCAGRSFCED
jgi:hypothetical protein